MTKLEHSNSYELKCGNPVKEAIELQLDLYKTMIANPMAEKFNDIINEMIKDTKEKTMNTKTKLKAGDIIPRLHDICNTLELHLTINEIVDTPETQSVRATIDSLHESKTIFLFADLLTPGWYFDLYNEFKILFGRDIHHCFNEYVKNDLKNTKEIFKYVEDIRFKLPKIKEVRFNGPATIIFWEDNTKTVVKAQDEDIDYEKGIAMAIAKKALGNKGNYFNEIKKWLPEEEEAEITLTVEGDILADLSKSLKEAFCPQEITFEFKVKEID